MERKSILEKYFESVANKKVYLYLKSGALLTGSINDLDSQGLILDSKESNTYIPIESIISITENPPKNGNSSKART